MRPLAACRDILVFRALVLGDWLCATPALRALRAAAPSARIALCGLPWTAELARRLPMADEFLEFPGHPQLPERRPEPGLLERFIAQARERQFDLALQMHGSGGIVNALVESLDARWTAGFATPGTEAGLDLAVPWPNQGPEIERCLALTDALGARRCGLGIEFPLATADRREAAAVLAAAGVTGPYAVIHPGSQLPSRRWAPERFAAIADALASKGLSVVITGSADESLLAVSVRSASQCAPIDLTGRTATLWTLGALVASAAIVVANDTGISHIAAALGTPSAVIACGSDVSRWAPLDKRLHPVHWHHTPCRPCDHSVCPTAHECAAGVHPREVLKTVFNLLESQTLCHATAAFAS